MTLSPEDETLFRRRFRGPHCDAHLAHARRLACEYAQLHAAGMPDWVHAGVAALHFRHCYFNDVGEKQHLRAGIDSLLGVGRRSEEHTSELQSLMRISYAVFCLKKKKNSTILSVYPNTLTHTIKDYSDQKSQAHI